jgi:hypothetical protein
MTHVALIGLIAFLVISAAAVYRHGWPFNH